ncbi:DUF6602 domain-containing protein [Methylobacterium bullatum]|uniref:DUF6602 domain-containing protein n=1 Tax=Methylobacterium bullatum TaxID=570505 RepID=A0AAV4Z5F7_9HYPH|nr:DUF6602 domain-containing protein [Methylobacterium bullatum]GJD38878.1 hypothetical protein OICFNHDK_1330 [Methylobacterium bullatum]
MSDYTDNLLRLSESLLAQYKTIFKHLGNRGDSRENAVKEYLERIFPFAFGFSKGEMFDCRGRNSGEVDIIIYDRIYSPLFYDGSNKILCPTESSYGTIECKSTLTKKELNNCITKADRYADLERPQAQDNEFYVTPHQKLTARGGMRLLSSGNAPSFGIFAFKNTVAIPTILNLMENNINIHYIVVPEKFIFIRDGGTNLEGNVIKNVIIESAESIAIWVILLQMRLTATRLISVDQRSLLNSLTSKSKYWHLQIDTDNNALDKKS